MRSLALLRGSLLATLLAMTVAAAADEIGDIQRLLADDRLEQAMQKVDNLMAKDPESAQVRFLKGLILVKQERTGPAIQVFKSLTRDFPELPEPYNNLAVLYAAEGSFEDARDALLVAISTHPSYATAHENLGDIYAKMASMAYDRALELDSGNRAAQSKLGLVNELFSVQYEGAPALGSAQPVSAPVPARSVEATVAVDNGVLSAVQGWADAWSAKDVAAYLSHYASGFRPANGSSRSVWEAQREKRLGKPRFITIEVINPKVSMISPKRATVRFVQSYRSDTYKDRVSKSLVMTKIAGDWKILKELSR